MASSNNKKYSRVAEIHLWRINSIMYYFIYKTTNNLNGKYYIGVHSTNDLNDGYMGSGIALKDAIKKYGVENFTREILEFFSSSKDAFKRESEIVDQAFIELGETYNLKIGGSGGYIGEQFYKEYSVRRTGSNHSIETIEKIRSSKLGEKNPFYGKRHTGDKTRFAHKKNERNVIIDGVTYDSCTHAALSLDVSKSTISKWIQSGRAVKVNG